MLDIYHTLKCESFISIILIQNHTKAIYKFNLHHYVGKRNKIFQIFVALFYTNEDYQYIVLVINCNQLQS